MFLTLTKACYLLENELLLEQLLLFDVEAVFELRDLCVHLLRRQVLAS